MIIKYKRTTSESSILVTRNIDPSEWKGFNGLMGEYIKEARIKCKNSYKSGRNVWIKLTK